MKDLRSTHFELGTDIEPHRTVYMDIHCEAGKALPAAHIDYKNSIKAKNF